MLFSNLRSNDPIPSSLFSFTPLNVFTIDNNTLFEDHKRFREIHLINDTTIARKPYPATSFAIMVSSLETLKKFLDSIRDSVWWNHEAFFLLIDTNLKNCEI